MNKVAVQNDDDIISLASLCLDFTANDTNCRREVLEDLIDGVVREPGLIEEVTCDACERELFLDAERILRLSGSSWQENIQSTECNPIENNNWNR